MCHSKGESGSIPNLTPRNCTAQDYIVQSGVLKSVLSPCGPTAPYHKDDGLSNHSFGDATESLNIALADIYALRPLTLWLEPSKYSRFDEGTDYRWALISAKSIYDDAFSIDSKWQ